MERRKLGGILFLVIILAGIATTVSSPLGEWLTIARLNEARDGLVALVEARPLLYNAGFFLLCVVATAICFPVAPIIGISGGAVFGFWPALITVLIASSIGSTIAFLDSRYLLRGWITSKLGRRLDSIDRGFQRHGAIYLLSLRFNPVIPYWLVNLAMGLTSMRVATYLPLTVIGLFPATLLYVTAGTHLATIDSPGDVVSAELFALLLLLSLFPLLAARFTPARQPAQGGQPS